MYFILAKWTVVCISSLHVTKSAWLNEVTIVTRKSQDLNPHLSNSKAHVFNYYLNPSYWVGGYSPVEPQCPTKRKRKKKCPPVLKEKSKNRQGKIKTIPGRGGAQSWLVSSSLMQDWSPCHCPKTAPTPFLLNLYTENNVSYPKAWGKKILLFRISSLNIFLLNITT